MELNSRLGGRPKVVVFLVVSIGSAWWIGSHYTQTPPSGLDALIAREAVQSDDLIHLTPVEAVSPFDVVESVSLQERTDEPDANLILKPVAMERSLEAILAQPLTGESETALLDRLETWSVIQPADTAHWIEQTLSNAWHGSAADALRYPLLSLWVDIEPDVALAKLGAFADEAEIPYLMLSHANRMADESTPQEAFEWATLIEDKVSSEVVVDGLLQRWLDRDISALATHFETVFAQLHYGVNTTGNTALNDDQMGSLIPGHFKEKVATALIEQDPARALRWADALPITSAEGVRSEAIDNWLAHDPVGASDWLSGVLIDTGTLPVSLASKIPQHDIDLAIETLPSLSGASQDAMTSAIVKTLSEVDAVNARAWVDGLEDPQERSAAATVWAIANAERQPAEALDGALQSTSGLERLGILVDVAATVARVDQPLLESWLAAAPLSDYERSQIASVVLDTDDYPFRW